MAGVTIYVFTEAISVINENGTDSNDVNINILLGFAAANLFIDVCSIFPFCLHSHFLLYEPYDLDDENRMGNTQNNSKAKNVNMISAGVHVLGDTLRTFFMIAAAAISMNSSINGNLSDAWAAIAVSVVIFFLVALLLREIYHRIRQHYSRDSTIITNVVTTLSPVIASSEEAEFEP